MSVLKYACIVLLLMVHIDCKVLNKDTMCRQLLGNDLVNEIASYSRVTDEIFKFVLEGNFKGVTYNELAKFVDKFGARPSGSKVLEKSIDYMIELTQNASVSDIITEIVEVPHWVRGEESVTMLEPRIKNIAILGLGRSISTPVNGLTEEVIVIDNLDLLDATDKSKIEGKIVLLTPVFTTYKDTVIHRSEGAVRAAKKGAIACLIASITPFSINSPHTGSQSYDENVVKIPVAAIALEDAHLIQRLFNRGDKVILKINLSSEFDSQISRNTLIDLKGHEKPEKIVIVSGHIDSWDVGQGAMDDGGGMFISWAAPIILEKLNLIPKRTVRTIFWTAEELGLVGAYDYEKRHRNESDNIIFIMESDAGSFSPVGLEVSGTQKARCIIYEILKLFEPFNISTLKEIDKNGNIGSDIGVITTTGVPGASLLNANERYFWFHHTEGDTMDVEDPDELDLCAAFWTAVAYVIADLSIDIPR